MRGCKSYFEQKLVRARTSEPLLITDTPAEHFDKVSLGKYYIAVAIPYLHSNTIAHVVATTLFSQYGAPSAILTDREGSFIGNTVRKLEKLFHGKQLTTSDYRLQTNGSLEKTTFY